MDSSSLQRSSLWTSSERVQTGVGNTLTSSGIRMRQRHERLPDGAIRGFDVFDGKVRGDTNQYYRDFVRAMQVKGYGGYMSYELCHNLPVVDGQTVDIGYAHQQAQLAAEFMRDLIASADRRDPLSASNRTFGTTFGTTFGRPA